MPRPPLKLSGVLLLLAACSSPEEVREKTGVTGPAARSSASAKAKATASAAGKSREVSEETNLYSYEFSYPAQVGAYPELAAKLESEGAKVKAALLVEAKEAQADAKTNGYPFRPHSYAAEWKVVADVPGFLSLSNEFSTFSGGAHGMYGLEGLVWDKASRSVFPASELFLSPQSLAKVMGPVVCAMLDEERAERRGEPVSRTDDFIGGCPGLDEATILVGSSNKETFDRITIWFGPYVAGPYAEGAYELDFPMTEAMLSAVKPAYKAAFTAKK